MIEIKLFIEAEMAIPAWHIPWHFLESRHLK